VLLAKVYDVANNADSDDNLTPDRPISVEKSIPFYQARVYAIPRHDWTSYALNRVLQRWLQERAAVDKQVVVLSPKLVELDVLVTIRVYNTFDANTVKFHVIQAIQKYFTLSQDGEIQIGGTFHTSRLISILQQIQGVASLDMVAGLHGQSPALDITPDFDEIIQLNTVSVTISSSQL